MSYGGRNNAEYYDEHNCATCDCEGLHYEEAFEEMLAALKAIVREMDFLESTKAPCIPSLGILDQIQAAIAKAEKARGEK